MLEKILGMILEAVMKNPGFTLVSVLGLIQVSPIKLDPWNWIAKQIKNACNGEILEKQDKMQEIIEELKAQNYSLQQNQKGMSEDFESVQKELKELKRNQEEAEAERKKDKAESARNRIIIFSDECLKGEKHSKERWEEILRDIDLYEGFCRKNPDYPNEKAKFAISFVRTAYSECMNKTRSFLE